MYRHTEDLTGAFETLSLGRPHLLARHLPQTAAQCHFYALGDRVGVVEDALDLKSGAGNYSVFLGSDGDCDFSVVFLDDRADTHHQRLVRLRDVASVLGARDAGLATQAVALGQWLRGVRFCENCGTPLRPIAPEATRGRDASWARRCENDHEVFPRTDPAVIMAVVDGADRILLGNNRNWPHARFSALAGFVDAGESLEAAVRREVLEEAGVQVRNVSYRGSQPWPFPRSLMLGFRAYADTACDAPWNADLVSGFVSANPDLSELREAGFFSREELTARVRDGRLQLPGETSIAYALIAEWYGSDLRGLV